MAFLADALARIKPSATIAVTDKARALKIPILDEAQFRALLGSGPAPKSAEQRGLF